MLMQPVNVAYNSTGSNDLAKDPAIKTLISSCVNSGKSEINSQITLRFDVSAFSWLGIFPEVNIDKKLACPDITTILNLVKGVPT
jgi:hypothetical protein